MKKFLDWLKSSSSDFVLFVIFLVLLNFAGVKAFKRFDLTKPHSYSLSKASQNVVKNLSEPLTIRVFFDKNMPAPYNSVAQYVEDFLNEYKSAANKNFSILSMDMSKEENIDLASDFGLREVQIQEYKNNEVGFKQVFMGLVISYGDLIEKIDPITTSDGFEYAFTSKISKMINTYDALEGIKGDDKINISVYVSDDLKKLGIYGVDQVENAVSSVFADINKQKQNRLNLNFYHPNTTEAIELIEKYGIQGIPYSDGESEKTGALGVVVEYKDNFRVLPVSIGQSFFGYAVTGFEEIADSINEGIQSLMSKTSPIGYIIGNDEVDLADEKAGKTFGTMLSSMYDIKQIDLVTDDIPVGMNSIIINGPKSEFSEIELYKIDQFVMRGGNVMFFMDALTINPDDQAFYQGAPSNLPLNSELDTLLNAYGIKRDFNVVLDTQCFETSSSQAGKVSVYWAPLLQKKQLNSKHPITNNLGYVLVANVASVNTEDVAANPDTKVTVLAKSSDKSWTGDESLILHPLTVNPPEDQSIMKSENLAVLVEGKFKSAFEKAPDSLIPAIKSEDVNFQADSHLTESRLPGKIFFIGTSEITTLNVLGQNPDPIGNPIQMLEANLIDYMNGNEDLCKMRTKGLSLNTLTIRNQVFGKIIQYFNEFGLAILVAVAGLLVWRARARRKAKINAHYNPDDERTIEKKSKKTEKKGE